VESEVPELNKKKAATLNEAAFLLLQSFDYLLSALC